MPVDLQENLRDIVASRLRAVGADVVLRDEPRSGLVQSYLMLSLRAYRSTDGTQCAWGVDVDLHQPVQLQRDASIQPSNALTTHTARQGIVPCSELNNVLQQHALDLIQQFAWNYKHENE